MLKVNSWLSVFFAGVFTVLFIYGISAADWNGSIISLSLVIINLMGLPSAFKLSDEDDV